MDNLIKTLRSSTDSRDYKYNFTESELRKVVDLREYDSPIEDQKQLGSCVGNAIANAYELQVKHLYPETFEELSRLYIYYNARVIDNDVLYDMGTSIRSGLKGCNKYGICTEKLWPYIPENFNVKPNEVCYIDGKNRLVTNYYSVNKLQEVLSSVNNNYPVVIGIELFVGFFSLNKDNYTITKEDENDYAGNHAVVVVGYDIEKKILIAKNSFGIDWGLNGYFYIPFDYAEKYIFESWIFDILKPL